MKFYILLRAVTYSENTKIKKARYSNWKVLLSLILEREREREMFNLSLGTCSIYFVSNFSVIKNAVFSRDSML